MGYLITDLKKPKNWVVSTSWFLWCVHCTGAICIKTLLMENKTIASLCIEGNKLHYEEAVLISEGLRFNHTLSTLLIYNCGLSVEGNVVVRFVCGLDDSEVFHVM